MRDNSAGFGLGIFIAGYPSMKKLFRTFFHWLEGKDPLNLPPEYVNELDLEWIEATRRKLVQKRFQSIERQPAVDDELESAEMIPQLMRGGLRQSLNGVGQNVVTSSQRSRWFEKKLIDDEDWSERVEQSLLASKFDRRMRMQEEAEASFSRDYATECINRVRMESFSEERAPIGLPDRAQYQNSNLLGNGQMDYDLLLSWENRRNKCLEDIGFVSPVEETAVEDTLEGPHCLEGVFPGASEEGDKENCKQIATICEPADEGELTSTDNDDVNDAIDEELDIARIEEHRARIERELEELLNVDMLAAPRAITSPCLAFAAHSPGSRRTRANRGLSATLGVDPGVMTSSFDPEFEVSECLILLPDIAAASGKTKSVNAKKQSRKSGKRRSRAAKR